MIVKFGDNSVDLDTIVSVEDMYKLVSELPGQKKLVFEKERQHKSSVPEVLFDTCTEKEIAVRNLHYCLEQEYLKLKKQMFPASIGNLMMMAKDTGKSDIINVPPVDTEKFAELQKMTYLGQVANSYVNALIQTRVGFGLALSVANDGKIYAMTDLRELYKRA